MRKAALLILALLALPFAAAAKPRVLVELYTAQGCASCGEANAYVAKLAERPGLLALTFPVDYWDYLGWADTLARPQFTERQKAYVARLALREPYTPQVVIDGRAQAPGGKPERVEKLLRDAAKAPRDPPEIRFAGARVYVGSARVARGGAEVWLVRYDARAQQVAVRGGDNRGQTLDYRNVVRQLVKLGPWAGKPRAYRLPPAAEEGLSTAILVQGVRGGAMIGVLTLPADEVEQADNR